jgi:prepilin-type N-terminal cleavage/methylation domain-containing protein
MKFYRTRKGEREKKRGFTLVEIIVSLALFTVVAVIAVGAFLRILAANKQSQALQTAMNNANFALESMVRELRVGSNYVCFDGSDSSPISSLSSLPAGQFHKTTNCNLGTFPWPGIAFYSSVTAPLGGGTFCNLVHAYRLGQTSGTIEKAEQTVCNGPLGNNTNYFNPLTSSDLKIQQMGIEVDSSQYGQPKVFILLNGYTGSGSNARDTSTFTIQSTADQRLMNN